MNRKQPPVKAQPKVLVESLEPRIAPAGLLNESKFTSVTVGSSLLLDASGAPGTFQGLTTGSGPFSGSYLLYLQQGTARVFTTDLNGNGILDPGEITGISLGKDSLGRDPQLILFSDVKGDIVTNLDANHNLTDSDGNLNNGRDGRVLLGTNIAGITIRTLTDSDIDTTVPGNTVLNRLALTHFSVYGNIIAGGDVSNVSIDTSGVGLLGGKFDPNISPYVFGGAQITIGGIETGTAANYQHFQFTYNSPQVLAGSTNGSSELTNINVEGQLVPYHPAAGMHGGDINGVSAVLNSTLFSVGHIDSGAGGTGARGGDISGVTLHGGAGGYEIIAGDGGQGSTGGRGGDIVGFSDLGTVTGQSFLHTGTGGRGTLGAGGDGGTATFANDTNSSDFEVVLGAGGAGFTRGGNGAGLTSTVFTAPDVTLPVGGKIIGTWHDIGDIGNTHPFTDPVTGLLSYAPEVIDFDHDGFGDAVFTTTNPDQVVVVFGDGQGSITDPEGAFLSGIPQKTIILKVPGGGTPVVTVGDFNGDGKPDIAVASGNANNFGGVYVYLNQMGDTTVNPVNAANYTHNPVGDHPFGQPIFTGVPTLNNFGFYGQGGAILALAAGDFNGDGITDLAYTQRVETIGSQIQGQVTVLLLGDAATSINTDPARVGAHVATTFVNGSTDNALFSNATGRPVGTGTFYSNAAPINAVSGVQISEFFNNTSAVNLRASSTLANNVPTAATGGLPLAPESVFLGIQGTRFIESYTALAPNPVTHQPAAAGLGEVVIDLGQVDVNRLPDGAQPNVSLQDVSQQDFQISDANQDGIADLVAVSNTPQTFFIPFAGNGDGTFAKTAPGAGDGDQQGIALVPFPLVAPQVAALAVGDPLQTGVFSGFTVEFLRTEGGPHVEIDEYQLGSLVGVPDGGFGVTHIGSPGILVIDRQVDTLDAFYNSAPAFDKLNDVAPLNAHPATGYTLLAPDVSNLTYVGAYFLSAFPGGGLATTGVRFLTNNGINLYSGDGGSSSNGPGGNAGAIGDGTLNLGSNATTTASVQIVYTGQRAYEGNGFLHGGIGGSGFGGGGIGGDVAGVSTRVNAGDGGVPVTSLQAGNGGDGVEGDGGRGGGISSVSIEFGPAFLSGNGGNGLDGGAGGAILGNQVAYDTLFNGVTLSTGFGGRGQINGGAGGTINRWDSDISGLGGSLLYQTGLGGSGAAGIGGAGGSILDSSPDLNQNFLSGALTLTTGKGGSGLQGGNGGVITNFTNLPTSQAAVPTTLTVVTGAGGIGVSLPGGTGGTVTNFQSNAIGITSTVGIQNNGLARIIAGDGGISYGGVGGAGGNLTNLNSTATSSPLIAAAGQGGEGLTAGGLGGSISNSILNSAATITGKLVIVAGKGGDALAALRQDVFLPGDNDVADLAHAVLAFGGVTGLGGNGGSVINITQPTSTQTAVDIIAGNGGSTPNAGNAATVTTTVGQGGSVGGIILTGTLGSIQRDTTLGQLTNPPIKSYSATDPNTGVTTTSISEFVDFLANSSAATLAGFVLNDNAGNVGMVAGAAGTVRSGQPALNGINGSVTGVSASSILSIVAGSVDRVAPVANLSGVVVTNPDGVLGADKSVNAPYGPNGALDYYNTQGVDVANLQPGYRLIDGAIFASNIIPTAGQPIVGPRVNP